MLIHRISAAIHSGIVLCGSLVVSISAGSALAQPAPFIPRPTSPYECASMYGAPVAWSGWFHGRKEVDRGFIQYWNTFEHFCFTSERDCRNWLYNMQSEYTVKVWRAECRPGLD